MLIRTVRADMYSHLQMSLESHWAFCESSMDKLKQGLEQENLPWRSNLRLQSAPDLDDMERPSQSEALGTRSQEQHPTNAADGTKQMPAKANVFHGLWGIRQIVKVPAQARTSKFISRAAGERQWQNLSPVKRMVTSMQFDAAVGFLIMANAIFMGVQVEHSGKSLTIEAFQVVFCFCFALELVLRVIADRRRFFSNDLLWNLFDCTIVIGSIIELIMTAVSSGDGPSNFLVWRCMRFLRFLRVARMLRIKAFRELRLMIQSIMCCMKPLTWTVSLLALVLYIVAIVFAQATRDAMRNGWVGYQTTSKQQELLIENFQP